jgi:hypothetical protein
VADAEVTLVAYLRDQASGGITKLQQSIGRLAAGFSLLTLARKAYNEAEKQADADAALRAALLDNTGQFQRLADQASRLQEITKNADDDVEKLQATLLNRGTSVGQIEQATQAAVDLAAALGTSLEAAGEQIAVTYSGVVPRSLARAVPELRRLTDEQLRNGDAVALIARRYAGFSQQQANTPFGQIKKDANAIGDALETVGNRLAEVLAKLSTPVARTAGSLAEFLSTKEAGVLARRQLSSELESGELAKNSFPFVTSLIDAVLPKGVTDRNAQTRSDVNRDRTNLAIREGYAAELEEVKKLNEETKKLQATREDAIAFSGGQTSEEKRAREMERLNDAIKNQTISLEDYFRQLHQYTTAADDAIAEQISDQIRASQEREAALRKFSDNPKALADANKELGVQIDLFNRLHDVNQRRILDVQRERAEMVKLIESQHQYAHDELTKTQAQTAALFETDNIGLGEATARDREAVEAYRGELRQLIDEYQHLADTAEDAGEKLALNNRVRDLKVELATVRDGTIKLGTVIKDSLDQPLQGFFQNAILNTRNLRQAFANMLQGFASNIAAFVAQQATQKLLGSILGGGYAGAAAALVSSGGDRAAGAGQQLLPVMVVSEGEARKLWRNAGDAPVDHVAANVGKYRAALGLPPA